MQAKGTSRHYPMPGFADEKSERERMLVQGLTRRPEPRQESRTPNVQPRSRGPALAGGSRITAGLSEPGLLPKPRTQTPQELPILHCAFHRSGLDVAHDSTRHIPPKGHPTPRKSPASARRWLDHCQGHQLFSFWFPGQAGAWSCSRICFYPLASRG